MLACSAYEKGLINVNFKPTERRVHFIIIGLLDNYYKVTTLS